MNGKYICIEGNIGAGKTTFAKRFAEITGSKEILEQFSENPFLEPFYKDPKKHAFPLELSFLAERFEQLNNIFSNPSLFQTNYVADYSFAKTLLFAKKNLREEELRLFQTFYRILVKKLPKPTLVIYLHTDLEYIKENIFARARSFENLIDNNYLRDINENYKNDFLTDYTQNFVIIRYNKDRWNSVDQLINTLWQDTIPQLKSSNPKSIIL